MKQRARSQEAAVIPAPPSWQANADEGARTSSSPRRRGPSRPRRASGPPPSRGRRPRRVRAPSVSSVRGIRAFEASERPPPASRQASADMGARAASSPRRRGPSRRGRASGPPPSRGRRPRRVRAPSVSSVRGIRAFEASERPPPASRQASADMGARAASSPRRRGPSRRGRASGPPPSRGRRPRRVRAPSVSSVRGIRAFEASERPPPASRQASADTGSRAASSPRRRGPSR